MNKEKILNILKYIASLIVIISMFIIIFYQNRDRDILKFGREESSKVIKTDESSQGGETYSKSDVQRIDEDIIFVTPSSVSILNSNGEGKKTSLAISNPILHAKGKFSVIYEVGATQASVYKGDKLNYSIAAENKIIKAKVNSDGYLVLATEKEGYNCECTVYNRSGEAIFKWSISKSEFLDAVINSSNNAILVSVAAANADAVYGEIELIDITDAKVIKKQSVKSQLFFDVEAYENDTYCALGNESMIFLNSDGTAKWSYKYDGKKLITADTTNPDMMVLAFIPKKTVIEGSSSEVVVLNRLGKITGTKIYKDDAKDISLSDNSIALSFGRNILITDNELKEKKEIKSETPIRKIALFNDNKHVFVIGNSESKILK